MRAGTDRAAFADDFRRALRPRYFEIDRRSLYVPMRDGASIAVDVRVPRHRGGERLPTILRQTRYYRAFGLPRALSPLVNERLIDPMNAAIRELFLRQGFAWVDVDARGSGASFGQRPCPWFRDEVEDGAELVNWVVAQPWSNGKVGAMGVSYDGTAAEMLLANRHPAVRAVAPRFSLFDVYADVAFPGGLHLSWFTEAWGNANAALDRNDPGAFVGEVLRLAIVGSPGRGRRARRRAPDLVLAMVEQEAIKSLLGQGLGLLLGGVRPVDGDPSRSALREAIASHAQNFNVHHGALAITFRDDPVSSPTHALESIDVFSPHRHAGDIDASGAAVLSQSGWLDGAYAGSAAKRHRRLTNGENRLLLGPWSHGGQLNMSPSAARSAAEFDHAAELLRFFERHLRPSPGAASGPRVRYYTMVADRWNEAECFPPPSVIPHKLHLAPSRRLTVEPPARVLFDAHRPDVRSGAGPRSRWRTLLSPMLHPDYPDRAYRDRRLMVFTGSPLDRPTEVTGSPRLSLRMASSERDGAVFAYLEDEAPDGHVTCVTEGQLRLLHRRERDGARSFCRADGAEMRPGEMDEVAFDLLPISYLFERGHRVRLALSGADVDHFTIPQSEPTWHLELGGEQGSWLELPVDASR